jgi:site-specific recombinase XerC
LSCDVTDILAYLEYCREVRQNAKGTLDLRWNQLRHLLEWADETPLAKGAGIRPTVPGYLTTASNGRTKGENLSYRTQSDSCKTAQAFLRWATARRPGYKRIDTGWIDSLRPKRQGKCRPKPKAWTIEHVRKIAAHDPPTLTLERIQAAIVMMFLSGMRVGAFVTLPIKAVDLAENEISQWPEWGVHTKNLKKGTTSLLQIPDLLEVVRHWDRKEGLL